MKIVKWFALGGLLGAALFIGLLYMIKTVTRHSPSAPYVRYHNYPLNQKAIEQAEDFTVLISDEGFGGIGRGTGILLDSTHVLTCAHMVPEDNAHDMWVYTRPVHTVYKARPVFGSQYKDLAILELSAPVERSHYAVFNSSYTVGQPITIIGNTLGCMQWFVSYGLISGSKTIYLLTDGLIRGGNSGGPWINDNGEVLALTDWGLQDNKGKNLEISGGISAATIQVFLQNWKEPSILQMLLGG
jgi:S1-C subfamily serine protease